MIMSNKKFVGYYIIGAESYDDAVRGAGLILWSQKKPSSFIKFMNKLLLNIYWVDKKDHDEFVKVLKELNVQDVEVVKTEMPKRRSYNKTKVDGTTKRSSNKRTDTK